MRLWYGTKRPSLSSVRWHKLATSTMVPTYFVQCLPPLWELLWWCAPPLVPVLCSLSHVGRIGSWQRTHNQTSRPRILFCLFSQLTGPNTFGKTQHNQRISTATDFYWYLQEQVSLSPTTHPNNIRMYWPLSSDNVLISENYSKLFVHTDLDISCSLSWFHVLFQYNYSGVEHKRWLFPRGLVVIFRTSTTRCALPHMPWQLLLIPLHEDVENESNLGNLAPNILSLREFE